MMTVTQAQAEARYRIDRATRRAASHRRPPRWSRRGQRPRSADVVGQAPAAWPAANEAIERPIEDARVAA